LDGEALPTTESQCVARIGTAGWSIPANERSTLPQSGSVLEKYADCFNAVEINTSFYRPHKTTTYEKWATQVPPYFSFAVKLPRDITHHARLMDIDQPLRKFADEVIGLGEKLGCLLVQLPPSFAFSLALMRSAFSLLHTVFSCPIVCEPRHISWFSREVDWFLQDAGVTRAAADPALCPAAAVPGGDLHTSYYRLHGSPQMYYSDYSAVDIQNYARLIVEKKLSNSTWCIFDNTANGCAFSNAKIMKHLVS
jgi:uncharacterized protein YecE (DUF72 family)